MIAVGLVISVCVLALIVLCFIPKSTSHSTRLTSKKLGVLGSSCPKIPTDWTWTFINPPSGYPRNISVKFITNPANPVLHPGTTREVCYFQVSGSSDKTSNFDPVARGTGEETRKNINKGTTGIIYSDGKLYINDDSDFVFTAFQSGLISDGKYPMISQDGSTISTLSPIYPELYINIKN